MINLRKVQIELLDEFVRICEVYNLTYFLTAGTLLGAVRHKGYIPWDDDIDVAMSRKDYEKFKDIYENEKDTNYYLLSNRSSGDIKFDYRSYTKFCKKGTIFADNHGDPEKYTGIFIDIWPFDKCFLVFSCIQTNLIKHTWKFYRLKSKIDKPLKKPKYLLINIICFIFSLKYFETLHNKLYLIFNNTNAKYISFFCGSKYGYKNETHKYTVLFPLTKLKFEEKYYNTPGNWDVFLKEMYGYNYMQLPPENQRIDHNIKYIALSDSEIYYG